MSPGGECQWQVVAQDANGREICVSEVAAFEKPAYEKPKSGGGGGDDDNDCLSAGTCSWGTGGNQ